MANRKKSHVGDFKLFLRLSILNKKSYILITNTLIYKELNMLKNHNIKIKLSDKDTIKIYYKLGLINILKNLKKNNEYFVSDNSIYCASKNNHVNILGWLKDSGSEFKYTDDAIDYASQRGHINILKW